jgi:hypothetical protein
MDRGKALLGLSLVAVGIVLLLGAADVLDAGRALATGWPAVVVAAGLLAMVGRPPALLAGGLVAGVGLVLLGVTTGTLSATVWAVLWPALLVALGGWVLLGRPSGRRTDGGDRLDVICVFSGREVISVADPFRGGTIAGVFGGVDLDLSGAVLPPEGATLDAVGVFGGAEITVPPGWRVRINGPAIFGGFENEAEAQRLQADAPTLDVRGIALFGGVGVKVATTLPPLETAGVAAEVRR